MTSSSPFAADGASRFAGDGASRFAPEALRLFDEAARERLILLLNHVLGAEPVAMQRLKPHAGRRLRVTAQGWPRLLATVLPAPAPLVVTVTPAGLLELGLSVGTQADAGMGTNIPEVDLDVRVDTTDPMGLVARVLAGGSPSLQVSGDAALASDVNWLADHLRWDVAADLQRLIGPVPTQKLQMWAQAVATALRQAGSRMGGG